jgi:hypothetical protein
MTPNSARLKAALSYGVNLAVLAIALFVSEIRQLPFALQLLMIAAFAGIQSATPNRFDYIREKTANVGLRSRAHQLHLNQTRTEIELDELKQVLVSFLEHSEIYREKVKDHLKLAEDYLCIVKSSEGLSHVFTAMERKEMLPFGSVLMRVPGAVKPFENMSLFLMPTKSLPGINEWNIRQYIAEQIIPEVENERQRFLEQVPRKVAAKAEAFSYKYMAFLLRRGSIAHDVLNRKFNRDFNAFIVDQQAAPSYARMKDQLAQMVRAKELLALVNWASFANLNRAQRALVEQYKHKMSSELANAGIDNLADLAETTPERFLEVVWSVLCDETTKKKALNISKRVVAGASNTVEILRKHGVRL